jgi:kynurenine formamidase
MLEIAPVEIREADILIIHTGWRRYWGGQKQQD